MHFSTVLTDRRALLACFSVGLFIRLIPELLAFPHPIGFDTIRDAVMIKNGLIWSSWSTFFSSTWLLYGFLVPIYQLSGIDALMLLKISAPVLYGLSVAGVFWFTREELNWNLQSGLLASGFFVLQLASLRISWDLLRNTLGMGLLLFTLPLIRRIESKSGFFFFVLLSLLTVFAHEYSAVILLAILAILMIRYLTKTQRIGEFKRLLAASSPAFIVFLIGIFFRVFPTGYSVVTNILGSGDAVNAGLGKLASGNVVNAGLRESFFLVNYFGVKSSLDYYPSYGYLALNVVVLFVLLYVSYLFLVCKGFFRNGMLDTWTALLLVGSFCCLVFPFCAVQYWHRWMFMLAYPFTFYAINALNRFSAKHSGAQPAPRILSRKLMGFLLATCLLGSVYLATPVLMSTLNVGVFSIPFVYKYFSSSPTVPYQDVDGVVQAMEWLNKNMSNSSCVILHQAFLFWGELHLDKSHTIVAFESDFNAGLAVASKNGFTYTYSVWWNQNIGWYDITIPSCFVRVKDFGRISVYEHTA